MMRPTTSSSASFFISQRWLALIACTSRSKPDTWVSEIVDKFWVSFETKEPLGGYKPTMPDSFYPLDYYVPHHRLLITLTIDPPVGWLLLEQKATFLLLLSYSIIVLQAVIWLLLIFEKERMKSQGKWYPLVSTLVALFFTEKIGVGACMHKTSCQIERKSYSDGSMPVRR